MTNPRRTDRTGETDTPLIDRFLPEFDVVEHHETLVRAPAAVTYQAMRGLDMARSRMALALLAARGLIALAQPREARRLYGPLLRRPRLTLDDAQRVGFVLLEEEVGREIVLGVVGAFWKPGSGIRQVPASSFVSWDEPGSAKAVWNFAVRAVPEGSVLSTETRVRGTDEPARRSFGRYWRLIGPFSGLIRRRLLSLIKGDAERSAGRHGPAVPAGTIDEEG